MVHLENLCKISIFKTEGHIQVTNTVVNLYLNGTSIILYSFENLNEQNNPWTKRSQDFSFEFSAGAKSITTVTMQAIMTFEYIIV